MLFGISSELGHFLEVVLDVILSFHELSEFTEPYGAFRFSWIPQKT